MSRDLTPKARAALGMEKPGSLSCEPISQFPIKDEAYEAATDYLVADLRRQIAELEHQIDRLKSDNAFLRTGLETVRVVANSNLTMLAASRKGDER